MSLAKRLRAEVLVAQAAAVERMQVFVAHADALVIGSGADEERMRDQASVVRGYVSLYNDYPPGFFPWKHVEERVERMRLVRAGETWGEANDSMRKPPYWTFNEAAQC